jgi:uncharacterized protein YjbI with pentapeptide repeats
LADLKFAKLYGTGLISADLSEAKLNGAKLTGADLSGARLDGAEMEGAKLNFAYLKGALGMTLEELEKQVKSLQNATMPDSSKHS